MCIRTSSYILYQNSERLLRLRRFAGCEFPPMIYFKVFTCNKNGFGVQYVSGQKMIKPASEVLPARGRLFVPYDPCTANLTYYRVYNLWYSGFFSLSCHNLWSLAPHAVFNVSSIQNLVYKFQLKCITPFSVQGVNFVFWCIYVYYSWVDWLEMRIIISDFNMAKIILLI